MGAASDAIAYVKQHQDEHLAQYKEFLSLPSVSTLSEHNDDTRRTAHWVAEQLRGMGMTRVDIMPTKKHPAHPIVYAEWMGARGKPTVLIYGHYDVQPVDPLNEWESGPFDPTVRGDYIFARGASDMKGQIFAQMKAVEALARDGGLPVNVKYIIEGEEEIGSPNLPDFIDEHKHLLKADYVLNCDCGIHEPDVPAITYALRGLAYYELTVHGPKKDLHSGLYGGSILNPLQALCELIAGMHDDKGRVTLPGFYDDVRELSDEERAVLAKVPYSDERWKEVTGSPALWGEDGYTTVERIGARPTLEVNGIWGGFMGEGSKTVLPAVAHAKLSMRLVPDQKPESTRVYLEAYLKQQAPEGVIWKLEDLAHGPGAVMDRHSPAMKAAEHALEQVFGKPPLFKREGGSVPIVGLMQQKLGLDSVMLGFALPDDGIHGPNERQYLPNFFRGIEAYVLFMAELGNGQSK